MYYVYILLLSNNTLYTGSTGNIKQRLAEHCRGQVTSTKSSSLHQLILLEMYVLKSDAQRRERFLKTTEGKRLLRMQLRDILIQKGYIQTSEIV